MEENKNTVETTEETAVEMKEEAYKADQEKEEAAAAQDAAEDAQKAVKDSDRKETIAIVLAVLAILALAGSKFAFGSVFFYIAAFILALIGFILAMQSKELTKKAIVALVVTLTPMIVAGYNGFGTVARNAFIDHEVRKVETRIRKDARSVLESEPALSAAINKDMDDFDAAVEKDAAAFKEKVKEDAALVKNETAESSATISE